MQTVTKFSTWHLQDKVDPKSSQMNLVYSIVWLIKLSTRQRAWSGTDRIETYKQITNQDGI